MIVYKITNIINGKIYIGQSKFSLEIRWAQHKYDAKRNIDNYHFHNAIRKYGTECWKLEILEEIEDISLLNEAEMKWIEYYDTFNNGYNSTTGGDGGYIRSEETKEKIRQTSLGKHYSPSTEFKNGIIPWNTGKLYPQASERMKINNPMSGKHHTDETKEKISKARLGHIVTEETKEKLRQANLGQISWNKGKNRPLEVKNKIISGLKDYWSNKKIPIPIDFILYNNIMSIKKLSKYYNISEKVVRRWKKEIIIYNKKGEI